MSTDHSDFTQGSILKKLSLFMLPVLGALILQAAYGAVDLLVVGRFGSTSGLSAVSTGSQVLNLVTFVVTQLAMGVTVLIARYIGEKREKEIGAVLGGAAGITIRQAVVWGLRRSAFSNEAGLGSAPIAHAAAHCDGPVEQGIYGIFEVFMDTIVICTLTALTIIISGVDVTFGVKPGSALITAAFGTVFNGTFSSVFIAVALTLFAYSTILGWSLYGSRCVQYLLGLRAAKVYQFVFIIMIVVGSVSSLDFVWNIADTLNGLMAIPNFIALFALSPVIFKITREYFRGVDLASAKHE